MNNTVICYYEPFPSAFSRDSLKLISMWKKSWAKNGWNVIVLNKEFAKQHSKYREYDIDNFSNVLYNNWEDKGYLRSCYRRLFAYCHFVDVNGPTLWADYDVMNYSFNPSFNIENNTILGSGTSVVYLDGYGSDNIIDNIFSKPISYDHRENRMRFNPMKTVIKSRVFKKKLNIVQNDILTQYEKCKTSKFVHYHGGYMNLSPEKKFNTIHRSDFIQKFRPVI